MKLENLDKILEAILFMSGNGISLDDLQNSLGLQKSELKAAVKKLKERYGGESGIHLISYNNKIQFGTNPEYAEEVSAVLNPIKERELTNATLETVAIIAYRQPITKLEIEQIRGLSCDYTIQVLLKNNLIEIVGRKDSVGKPLLYGTTEEFLKRFQIESIDCLPDYEKLMESIKVLHLEDNKSLYNEFEIPEEEVAAAETDDGKEEIPDFLQGEKVDRIE